MPLVLLCTSGVRPPLCVQILEECGYDVQATAIQPVTSYLSGTWAPAACKRGSTLRLRSLSQPRRRGAVRARTCPSRPPIHPLLARALPPAAIGISGSRQTIFAAEVDDSMAVGAGGGGGLQDHGEAIEVLALPVAHIEPFMLDESIGKSAGGCRTSGVAGGPALSAPPRRLPNAQLPHPIHPPTHGAVAQDCCSP